MRLRSSATADPFSADIQRRDVFPSGHEVRGPIGELLVGEGLITSDAIPEILTYQQEHGLLFGEAAVQMGKVDAGAMEVFLASKSGFPLLAAGDDRIDPLVSAAFGTTGDEVAKVRAVRARIMSTLKEDEDSDRPRLIGVVGIDSGDEAAILAANLAVISAQLGSNTILVDCGLEKPTADILFRLGNRSGLTTLLEAQQSSSALQSNRSMQRTAIPRLLVMPTGPTNSSAAAYLQKRPLMEMVEQWAVPNANVIVALPEVQVGAMPLGTVLEGFDSVVLVVRRGETGIAEVRRVIDDLDAKAIPVAGSVIT